MYNHVPHDSQYFEDLKDVNEKLNNQSGNRFTKDEASDLLDRTLLNVFDAEWDMGNYFFTGRQNSTDSIIELVIISLIMNIVIIILLFILVCRNQRIKIN